MRRSHMTMEAFQQQVSHLRLYTDEDNLEEVCKLQSLSRCAFSIHANGTAR